MQTPNTLPGFATARLTPMKFLRLVALLFLPALALANITSQTDITPQYTAASYPSAVTVTFPFQFATDLLVLDQGQSGTSNDPALILTLGSDYTVSGGSYNTANNMQPGSVTLLAGGAHNIQVNDVFVIMRNVPINQLTSLVTGGPLTTTLIEQALDKTATISQQLNNAVGRSLRFENGETIDGTLNRTARSSMVLGFDANGNIFYYPPTTGGGGGGISGATAGGVVVATSATAGTTYSGFTSDMSGNVSVNSLKLPGGGTINGSAGALSMTGNLTFTTAPAVISSLGTLEMEAIGGITLSTSGNITLTSSGTINLEEPVNFQSNGTAGQVLTSNGSGSPPTFQASGAGGISGATVGAILVATGTSTGTSYPALLSDTYGNVTLNSIVLNAASAFGALGVKLNLSPTYYTTFLYGPPTANNNGVLVASSAGLQSYLGMSNAGPAQLTSTAGINLDPGATYNVTINRAGSGFFFNGGTSLGFSVSSSSELQYVGTTHDFLGNVIVAGNLTGTAFPQGISGFGFMQSSHFLQGTGGGTTTIALGAAAGSSPGTPSINTAGDFTGQISFTTGTSTLTTGTLFTVTYGHVFAVSSRMVLWPGNAAANAVYGSAWPLLTGTTSTAAATMSGTALTASTAYVFNYIIVGQ